MKLTDPHKLLEALDMNRWKHLRRATSHSNEAYTNDCITYVEPTGGFGPASEMRKNMQTGEDTGENWKPGQKDINNLRPLAGKIQRLGDFINTDAVSPQLSGLLSCL